MALEYVIFHKKKIVSRFCTKDFGTFPYTPTGVMSIHKKCGKPRIIGPYCGMFQNLGHRRMGSCKNHSIPKSLPSWVLTQGFEALVCRFQ